MEREPFLQGETIDLYPIEKEDLEAFKDIINMPEVRIPLNHHYPLNMQDEEDWFENSCQKDNHCHLLIHHKQDDKKLGTVGIEIKDLLSRVAELGFFLHPDYHGQTIGTEAATLAIEYAFTQLNLHKIHARAFMFNQKSIGLMEKLGFEQEGRQKEHVYINGEHTDSLLFGLLRKNWSSE